MMIKERFFWPKDLWGSMNVSMDLETWVSAKNCELKTNVKPV